MTSAALKTLYASGGSDVRLACLSFRCETWPASVHLCQSWTDISATLETGESVIFLAADFAAQLAKKAADGQNSLQFAIDPRQSDALSRIDQALAAGKKVFVDYREFLVSDLSAPARPVESMTVVSYSYQYDQLILNATFYELVNRRWPRLRYTTQLTPGLKYYGS